MPREDFQSADELPPVDAQNLKHCGHEDPEKL